MKILNCHVEGFGGIVNRDFSFNGELSSFVFENGYGKTTVAAFIKAMLYGLDSYKKNSKGFEDRYHFAPFSGARFGGNLTLSYRGSEYKIERFFDLKSQTKDTLRVYKNGRETDELGDGVGDKIFGFDKDSFEKLLFIKADTEDCGSTPGIKSKLNHFVMDGGEISEASDILEAAKKRLKAARGNGGFISRERERRLELLADIKNLENLSFELDGICKQKNDSAEKIKGLELSLKEKNDLKLKEQIYKSYSTLMDAVKEIKAKAKAISDKYPAGIPSSGEIASLKNAVLQREMGYAASRAAGLSEESRTDFEMLRSVFKDGLPSDEETEKIRALLKRRTEISVSVEKSRASDEDTLLASSNLPTKEVLSPYKEKLAEYKRLSEESNSLIDADSTRHKKSAKKLPLILGILLILLSVPLFFVHIAFLFAAAAVGVSLVAISFIGGGSDSAVTLKIAELNAKSRREEEQIRIFLSKYGFYSENGIVYDFSRLEEEIAERERASQRLLCANSEIKALLNEKETVDLSVKAFLNRFGFEGKEPETEFLTLNAYSSRYSILLSEKTRSERSRLQNLENIKRSEEVIGSFAEKHLLRKDSITADLLSLIEIDSQRYINLLSDLEQANQKVLLFKKEHSLNEEELYTSDAHEDAEDVELMLSDERKNHAALERTVNDIEDRLASLPEKQSELELCEERLADYENKYRLLTKTAELLKKADDNIVERFVRPVKVIFDGYLNELSEVLGKRFSMDIDFNLKFEENGEQRDERHLSSGQHAVVSLALKLSLLKAAFHEEEPFVIMDDPFVNLDEEHLEKAKSFLKAISKSSQIVYFSCHKSRNMQ